MIRKFTEKITGIRYDGEKHGGLYGVLLYIGENMIQLSILYYLIMVGALLPLYLPGYSNLGNDKPLFWIRHCRYAGVIFFAGAFITVSMLAVRFATGEKKPIPKLTPSSFFKKILPHEIWTVLFAASVLVSYALSEYKDIAYKGETGWFCGTWEYMAICIAALLVGRLYRGNRKYLPVIMLSSMAVNLTGIVFDLAGNVADIAGWSESKVSTIGNANWFCGYMVCVFFAGSAVYMMLRRTENDRRITKIFCIVYSVIGAHLIFLQGSSSIYLGCFAAFLAILAFCGRDRKKLSDLAELAVCFFAGGLLHALTVAFGAVERANDRIGIMLNRIPLMLFLLAVSVGIMVITGKAAASGKEKTDIHVGKVVAIVTTVSVVIYEIVLVFNTVSGGPLGTGPVLYFGEEWASSRGMTMTAGLELYGGMNFIEKLFGAGPDTFYAFSQSGRFPDLANRLYEYFYGARLTNAHCEPITMLVNTGIAGTVSFYGMLVSLLMETFRTSFPADEKCADSPAKPRKGGKTAERPAGSRKGGKAACLPAQDPGVRIVAFYVFLSITAYMVNNLFSFQTALNLSQMSLLLGFGANAVLRGMKTEDK